MIALRYLHPVKLFKITQTRQTNGAITEAYTLQNEYNAQIEEITDSVSVSLYGASVKNMLRLITPRNELESLLNSLLDPTTNNVTDYVIVIDARKYKISVTKLHYVDVELIGTYSQPTPSI